MSMERYKGILTPEQIKAWKLEKLIRHQSWLLSACLLEIQSPVQPRHQEYERRDNLQNAVY